MARKYLKKSDVIELLDRQESGEEICLNGAMRRQLRSYLAGYASSSGWTGEAFEIRQGILRLLGQRQAPRCEVIDQYVHNFAKCIELDSFEGVDSVASLKAQFMEVLTTCVHPTVDSDGFLRALDESRHITDEYGEGEWISFFEKYPDLKWADDFFGKNGVLIMKRALVEYSRNLKS